MGSDNIFQGSDGKYYGEVDLWEQLESGRWSVVCWDEETGEEWVETESGDLLALQPLSLSRTPEWLEIERTNLGIRIRSTKSPQFSP